MIHKEQHPKAGKIVVVFEQAFTVEDWWDRVAGGSWTKFSGNPACLQYMARTANNKIPLDDEVVYGKVCGMGMLIHETEIQR